MVFGHRTGKRSVRRRAPAEGLDDLDAVDILDERGVHGLLACDVARHLLFVSTHHAQVEQDAEWDGGDTRQPHAPIDREHDSHREHGCEHVAGKLRHEMRDSVFELIHVVDEAVLERPRGSVHDRPHRNPRHLLRHHLTHGTQGFESDAVAHHRRAPCEKELRNLPKRRCDTEPRRHGQSKSTFHEPRSKQAYDDIGHHA